MKIHHNTLKLVEMSKSFSQGGQETKVLDKITYTFEHGRSYIITGASGAGKSTLLHLLAGLERPTQGNAYLGDQDIHGMTQSDLRVHMGIVFQVPHLIDELTLVENVMIKGLIGGQDYYEASAKALPLLKRVGLAAKADCRPRTLSGGEQQRISVARALYGEPSFILADEPTAHLDQITRDELLSFLLEGPQGVIIVSHDNSISQRLEVALELVSGKLRQINLYTPADTYRVTHV